ncbi:flagellar hook-length control protein FliK [Brevundimonas sp.]|uniref:flagellar hook-length control protein FliK n=1 Tax=Brevundimonas sp. TaxID=1871086 RepID=UPI00391B291E
MPLDTAAGNSSSMPRSGAEPDPAPAPPVEDGALAAAAASQSKAAPGQTGPAAPALADSGARAAPAATPAPAAAAAAVQHPAPAETSAVAPEPVRPPDRTEAEVQAKLLVTAQPKTPANAAVASPPPPLRALAERTSRPLDQAAPTTDFGLSAEAKPAGATSSTPTSVAGQTDKPATPVSPVASPAEMEPISIPTESSSAGEPVAERTEATAAARDLSLSTLSRAAIDATAQIAAQILRKLEGRSTRFEIALRPDDLGRVDVKLDIDAEGRLSARLAFDNPAAATDLRGRTDELRRQLEAAGFELADDAFEFADRDSGSSAFDRGQDARQGQNRAFAAAARRNAEIDIAQPPQWLAHSHSPSGVDMKV